MAAELRQRGIAKQIGKYAPSVFEPEDVVEVRLIGWQQIEKSKET